MTQYVDKSTLVAEIERRRESNAKERYFGRLVEDNYFLDFLDTLEVKEVDFEKKKMEWIEQLCKYFKANYLYVSGHESFISDFRMYAKNLK